MATIQKRIEQKAQSDAEWESKPWYQKFFESILGLVGLAVILMTIGIIFNEVMFRLNGIYFF